MANGFELDFDKMFQAVEKLNTVVDKLEKNLDRAGKRVSTFDQLFGNTKNFDEFIKSVNELDKSAAKNFGVLAKSLTELAKAAAKIPTGRGAEIPRILAGVKALQKEIGSFEFPSKSNLNQFFVFLEDIFDRAKKLEGIPQGIARSINSLSSFARAFIDIGSKNADLFLESHRNLIDMTETIQTVFSKLAQSGASSSVTDEVSRSLNAISQSIRSFIRISEFIPQENALTNVKQVIGILPEIIRIINSPDFGIRDIEGKQASINAITGFMRELKRISDSPIDPANTKKVSDSFREMSNVFKITGLISKFIPGGTALESQTDLVNGVLRSLSRASRLADDFDLGKIAKVSKSFLLLSVAFKAIGTLLRFIPGGDELEKVSKAFDRLGRGLTSLMKVNVNLKKVEDVGKAIIAFGTLTKLLSLAIAKFGLVKVIAALAIAFVVLARVVKFIKSIVSIGEAIKSVAKFFAELNKIAPGDPKNIRLLKDNVRVLAEALNEFKIVKVDVKSIEAIGKLLDAVNQTMNKASKASGDRKLDSVGMNLARSIRESILKFVPKSITEALGNSFKNAIDVFKGDKLKSIGSDLRNVGEQIARAFDIRKIVNSGAFKSAVSFDDLLKQLKVFGGLTGDQLKVAKNFANEIGVQYPLSSNQALEATLDLIKAGQDLASTMQILPNAADLGSLSESKDIQKASGTLIIAEKTFKRFSDTIEGTFENIGSVSDIIFAGANATRASIDGLQEGLARVAPAIGTSNLNLEETVALLTQLEDAEIRGTEAGTALRTVIEAFQQDKARKELQQLGIAWKNQDGTLRSIADIIPDIVRRYEELNFTQAEISDSINNFGDVYARQGLRIFLANKGIEGTVSAMREVIPAAEGVKTLLESMSGQAEQLRGSVESLLTRALLPALDRFFKPVVVALRFVVDGINSLSDSALNTITNMVLLASAIGTIVGGATIALGALISFSGILTGIIFRIGSLILNIPALIAGLSVIATSLGVIVAVGGALVAGLYVLASIIETIFSDIENDVDGAKISLENLKKSIGIFVTTVKNLLKSLKTIVDGVFEVLFGRQIGDIKTAKVLDSISERFQRIAFSIHKFTKRINELGAAGIAEKIRSIGKGIAGAIDSIIKKITGADVSIGGAFSKIFSGISKSISVFINVFKSLIRGFSAGLSIFRETGDVVYSLRAAFVSTIDDILRSVGVSEGTILKVQFLANSFFNSIKKITESVSRFVKSASEVIGPALSEIRTFIFNFVKNLDVSDVVGALVGIFTPFGHILTAIKLLFRDVDFGAVFTPILDSAKEFIHSIRELFSGLNQGLTLGQAIEKAFGGTGGSSAIGNILSTVVEVVKFIKDALASVGNFIVDTGLPAFISFINSSVLPTISLFISEISKIFVEIAPGISESLLYIRYQFETNLVKPARTVLGVVGAVFTEIFNVIQRVIPIVARFVGFLGGTALPQLIKSLGGVLVPFFQRLAKDLQKAFEVGSRIINQFIDIFEETLYPILEFAITNVVIPFVTSFVDHFRRLVEIILPGITLIADLFSRILLPAIHGALKFLSPFIQGFLVLTRSFFAPGGLLGTIVGYLGNVLAGVIDVFQDILNVISGFVDEGRRLLGPLFDFIAVAGVSAFVAFKLGAVDAIKTLATTVLSNVPAMIAQFRALTTSLAPLAAKIALIAAAVVALKGVIKGVGKLLAGETGLIGAARTAVGDISHTVQKLLGFTDEQIEQSKRGWYELETVVNLLLKRIQIAISDAFSRIVTEVTRIRVALADTGLFGGQDIAVDFKVLTETLDNEAISVEDKFRILNDVIQNSADPAATRAVLKTYSQDITEMFSELFAGGRTVEDLKAAGLWKPITSVIEEAWVTEWAFSQANIRDNVGNIVDIFLELPFDEAVASLDRFVSNASSAGIANTDQYFDSVSKRLDEFVSLGLIYKSQADEYKERLFGMSEATMAVREASETFTEAIEESESSINEFSDSTIGLLDSIEKVESALGHKMEDVIKQIETGGEESEQALIQSLQELVRSGAISISDAEAFITDLRSRLGFLGIEASKGFHEFADNLSGSAADAIEDLEFQKFLEEMQSGQEIEVDAKVNFTPGETPDSIGAFEEPLPDIEQDLSEVTEKLEELRDKQAKEAAKEFEAEQKQLEKISDIDEEAKQDLIQKTRDFNLETERIAEDHQKRLNEIAKSGSEEIIDAVASRDSSAAQAAVKRSQEETKREEEQFETSEQRRQEDFELWKQDQELRRQQRKADAEQELSDLRASHAQARLEREEEFLAEKTKLEEEHGIRIQATQDALALEEQRRQQELATQQERIAEILASEMSLTDKIKALYGDRGVAIANSIQGFMSNVQNIFTSMTSALQSPLSILQQIGGQLSNTMSALNNFNPFTQQGRQNTLNSVFDTFANKARSTVSSFLSPQDIAKLHQNNPDYYDRYQGGPVISGVGSTKGRIGRAGGGPTSPENIYRVSEREPEFYQEGGNRYIIPQRKGFVAPPVPLRPSAAGAGDMLNISVDLSNMSIKTGSDVSAEQIAVMVEKRVVRGITKVTQRINTARKRRF